MPAIPPSMESKNALVGDPHDEVDLNEFAQTLRRNAGRLALWVIGLMGLAYLFTAISKPIYEARATLLLPLTERTANPFDFIPKADANPLGVLQGVLLSETAIREIAKGAELLPGELRKKLEVEQDAPRSQLVIRARGVDSEQTLKIVRQSVQSLARLDRDLGFSLASRQAEILREALDKGKEDVRGAEDRLLAYQRKSRTAPDPEDPFGVSGYLRKLQELQLELGSVEKELQALRQSAVDRGPNVEVPTGLPQLDVWREKLSEKEFDLRLAETKLQPSAPELVRLREEVSAAREQLEEEVRRSILAVEKNIDVEVAGLEARRVVLQWQVEEARKLAERAPGEAVEFQRLLREVNSAAEVLHKLTADYEDTRLTAEIDKIKWTLLEEPFLLEEPVNRRFIFNMALGGMLGFVLGLFTVSRRKK